MNVAQTLLLSFIGNGGQPLKPPADRFARSRRHPRGAAAWRREEEADQRALNYLARRRYINIKKLRKAARILNAG